MQEMLIKNVDTYTWYGDARKLVVKKIDGDTHTFNNVIDFTCKSNDIKYYGETEKNVRVRFETYEHSDYDPRKTSIEAIAKDVLAGKWGTGVDRKNNLEAAGYNYNEVQSEVNRMLFRYSNVPKRESSKIKNVIFKDPATIVFWKDGTKTVVKCGENDIFDPEKGLAMAVAKKYLGTNDSHSNYLDEFKKWLPKDEKPSDPFEDFRDSIKKLAEIGKSLNEGEHD